MMKPVLIVLAATIVIITVGMVLMMAPSEDRQVVTAPTPTAIPLESVAQAAEQDLPHLIERFQFDAEGFGFADEEEVKKITLGLPYELYILNYDQAESYTPDMPPEQVLEPIRRWEFPVLLDGQGKGMATLGSRDGTLQFVGISSNEQLAQSLLDFQEKRDHTEEEGSVKLLLVYPLHTTFALTKHNEQTQLTLILDVEPNQRWYFADLDASQTYDLEEVIPQIAHELRELERTAPTE